jgi:predicted nucleic acid-binding Zn ribbon protein
MYIRDFKCDECGHIQEEVFNSYKDYLFDEQYVKCAKCGEYTMPMFCGGNFSLKGGGWAKDGYGG